MTATAAKVTTEKTAKTTRKARGAKSESSTKGGRSKKAPAKSGATRANRAVVLLGVVTGGLAFVQIATLALVFIFWNEYREGKTLAGQATWPELLPLVGSTGAGESGQWKETKKPQDPQASPSLRTGPHGPRELYE